MSDGLGRAGYYIKADWCCVGKSTYPQDGPSQSNILQKEEVEEGGEGEWGDVRER